MCPVRFDLHCDEFSGFVFLFLIPKASSAGADAIDGDDGRVDEAHLFVLVDTELVSASTLTPHWRHLGVGLGTRWQKEAHATSDQHVPDAVDVEVVFFCLHEGIERHGWSSNGGAWEQEEDPAFPCRRVAAPPPNGAYSLK